MRLQGAAQSPLPAVGLYREGPQDLETEEQSWKMSLKVPPQAFLFAGLMLGGGLWTVQAVYGDRVVGGRSLSQAHKALLCELARFWLLFFPFFSVPLRVFPWVGCAGTHGGQTPRENWEN